MANVFSQPAFAEWFRNKLLIEFKEAAEPIIQKAVKDYEAEVRKTVGKAAVGMLEEAYSIERFGRDLRITVRVDSGSSGPSST